MARTRAETLEAFLRAVNTQDFEHSSDLVTDDYFEEYPQSGERVLGLGNVRAMVENYPGGLDAGGLDVAHAKVVGEDEQWHAGPSLGVIHVTGSGDTYVATTRSRYPDGIWYVIVFARFRGDRIAQNTAYFAPILPAPEWRARWVQRYEDEG